MAVAVLGLLGLAVAGPLNPAHGTEATRIMALGDSITGSPGCWRALLWNRLQSTGFTSIDMVGTLNDSGSCGEPFDGDNEGHAGYLATNIANQNLLPGWLSATQPDVVMMELGTNDVWNAVAPSTITAAFSKLVDQMRASKPTMKIIVAKITPMNPSGCPACGQRAIDLDNAIPAWAAGKSTSQSPITVVDQWTGYNTATDTIDGVHPNGSGNQKLSDHWYPALTAVLSASSGSGSGSGSGGGGGTSTGTRTSRIVGSGSGRCIDVPGLSTANLTQVQLYDCNRGINQTWTQSAASELRVYSGSCLDAEGWGKTAGTKVIIYTCTGGANQKWVLHSGGTITNVNAPGMCLDASGAGTGNGTLLQLWDCNGQTNQEWTAA